MQIKPCRVYNAVIADQKMLSMPDGKSVFKVYYLSLLGRDDPARYEWDRGKSGKPEFLERLRCLDIAGIGFITAFPHITKVFRFDPAAETVLHAKAFATADLNPLELGRAGGFIEFACYAEAAIAADEYRMWADAGDIGEYLALFSAFSRGAIARNAKMAAYFGKAG